MALTKKEVREFCAIVERVQRGSVMREDWSNMSALTLMAQSHEVIVMITAYGLDEFIKRSRDILDGHAYHYDDFRRIYDRVRMKADAQLAAAPAHPVVQ